MSLIRRISIVKMFILLKEMYRSYTISRKFPIAFFIEIEKNKIHMEPQKTPGTKKILRKRDRVGGRTLTSFKLYYKFIVIKILWFWCKNRHNGRESSIQK